MKLANLRNKAESDCSQTRVRIRADWLPSCLWSSYLWFCPIHFVFFCFLFSHCDFPFVCVMKLSASAYICFCCHHHPPVTTPALKNLSQGCVWAKDRRRESRCWLHEIEIIFHNWKSVYSNRAKASSSPLSKPATDFLSIRWVLTFLLLSAVTDGLWLHVADEAVKRMKQHKSISFNGGFMEV